MEINGQGLKMPKSRIRNKKKKRKSINTKKKNIKRRTNKKVTKRVRRKYTKGGGKGKGSFYKCDGKSKGEGWSGPESFGKRKGKGFQGKGKGKRRARIEK